MEVFNILDFIIVLLSLSGWISFLYLLYSNKPKVRGSIISISTAQKSGLTSYMVYPYIINYGAQPIELIDFNLEVNFGWGYIPMLKDIIQPDILYYEFNDEQNREIRIPDWPKQILYNKPCIAEYGNPLRGFLYFKGPIEYYDKKEISFKLLCTGSKLKKHLIFSDDSNINQFLFQDMTGVKFYDDYHIPSIEN